MRPFSSQDSAVTLDVNRDRQKVNWLSLQGRWLSGQDSHFSSQDRRFFASPKLISDDGRWLTRQDCQISIRPGVLRTMARPFRSQDCQISIQQKWLTFEKKELRFISEYLGAKIVKFRSMARGLRYNSDLFRFTQDLFRFTRDLFRSMARPFSLPINIEENDIKKLLNYKMKMRN